MGVRRQKRRTGKRCCASPRRRDATHVARKRQPDTHAATYSRTYIMLRARTTPERARAGAVLPHRRRRREVISSFVGGWRNRNGGCSREDRSIVDRLSISEANEATKSTSSNCMRMRIRPSNLLVGVGPKVLRIGRSVPYNAPFFRSSTEEGLVVDRSPRKRLTGMMRRQKFQSTCLSIALSHKTAAPEEEEDGGAAGVHFQTIELPFATQLKPKTGK